MGLIRRAVQAASSTTDDNNNNNNYSREPVTDRDTDFLYRAPSQQAYQSAPRSRSAHAQPSQPQLAAPWSAEWSPQARRYVYINTETGEHTVEHPTERHDEKSEIEERNAGPEEAPPPYFAERDPYLAVPQSQPQQQQQPQQQPQQQSRGMRQPMQTLSPNDAIYGAQQQSRNQYQDASYGYEDGYGRQPMMTGRRSRSRDGYDDQGHAGRRDGFGARGDGYGNDGFGMGGRRGGGFGARGDGYGDDGFGMGGRRGPGGGRGRRQRGGLISGLISAGVNAASDRQR